MAHPGALRLLRAEPGGALAYGGTVSVHPWNPRDPAAVLQQWGLVADGPAIITPSSHVIPVRYLAAPAMLKVPRILEERDGGRLMVRWAGRGAAPVLLHDDDAIVLERALGPRSLTRWVGTGTPADDDRATAVLCTVTGELHAACDGVGPGDGVPLERWFADLLTGVAGQEGFLGRAAALARALLDDQREVVVLHGDIHHGNVLDFGDDAQARWRAIDPKFLVGDRAFDYANIVCNPSHTIATTPGRLARQVSVICEVAQLARERLLRWIIAWTGLSATWYQGDPWMPGVQGQAAVAAVLAVGQRAEALLDDLAR